MASSSSNTIRRANDPVQHESDTSVPISSHRGVGSIGPNAGGTTRPTSPVVNEQMPTSNVGPLVSDTAAETLIGDNAHSPTPMPGAHFPQTADVEPRDDHVAAPSARHGSGASNRSRTLPPSETPDFFHRDYEGDQFRENQKAN